MGSEGSVLSFGIAEIMSKSRLLTIICVTYTPRTGSLGSQGKESHNPEGSTQQAAHKVRVEMVKAEHKVKIKMVKVRVSSRGGRGGGGICPPLPLYCPPLVFME